MVRLAGRIAAVLLCVVVGACGGGGGGSSSTPATPPAATERGAFTLGGSTAAMSAKRFGAAPAPVTLPLQVTGTDVAAVGAAYRDGIVPAPWLQVSIVGTAPSFTVLLRANTTVLAVGTYSTTISVGTADANGNILQYRDVQVSYSIRDGLAITSPPISLAATLGDSTTLINQTVNIATESQRWTVTSDVPWITAPTGTGQGAGPAQITLNTATLPLGQSTATVTVTNPADASDRATTSVVVTVAAPALQVDTTSTLLFGGSTGLEMQPRTARLTLGTGTNSYPWTATFVPASGGQWLDVVQSAQVLGAAGADLQLTPLVSTMPSGSHTGEVVVTANINGIPVTRSLPVALNVETQRLWAAAKGVALSSFPARQTLTRTVRIFNSQDRTDVALQVSSNQAWLNVSAPDGRSIVISASPAGLAQNQLHSGTVTVSSSDARIANQETIRVGLWVGSANPTDQAIAVTAFNPVSHPVEPLVFVNDRQSTIQAYNVYTGALARTITAASTDIDAMAFSDDGNELYVLDYTANRILAINPVNGAAIRTYTTSNTPSGIREFTLAYARPDGRPVLANGYTGEVFDAASGVRLLPFLQGVAGQVVATKDGRRLYVQTAGRSPTAIAYTDVRFSTLNSIGLVATRSVEWTGHFDQVYVSPGNGRDIALTDDDAHVYRANGAPYGFGIADPDTMVGTAFLPATPFPAAVECGWRGFCYGTAGPEFGTGNAVWIYNAARQPVGTIVLGAQNLYPRGLVLSADDTRLIVAHTLLPNDTRQLTILATPQ